ncbi:MAG: LLM class flavin-dependent oxidoreductase [Actinomycetota bacterium]|nr:LLM class flavin-dependent oxidoreductase [Actinomycetota bacterium]
MELAFQTVGLYEDVLEVARFSEDNGLVAIALPDHYLMAMDEEQAKVTPASDALVQLAGLARDTRDIELVVLVSPITFRHPAVLVKTAITIDRMSGGRFTLGIGTGWMDREHEVFGFDYPPMSERYVMLEEALAYTRAALSDEPIGYSGEHFTLEAFPISPRPTGDVKILVGGSGALKTPRLAGAYADEFNISLGDGLAIRIERARAAATAADRDPDALMLSSVGQIIGGETESDLEHRLGIVAAANGVAKDELTEQLKSRQRHAPMGTYAQLRERFAELEALGITRFYIQGARDTAYQNELLDALGA